ncbi:MULTISPECIES: hypothetical protein [Pseudomonas]|uniref:hypothetical protein n=1 Tax=Pseudomonas TaxID=286 RepID=UPI003002A25F
MGEISSILSALTIAAIVLYFFAWLVVGRESEYEKKGEGTWGFLWGGLFSASFYGFIVIGWYRYGFKKTFWLMAACLLLVFTTAKLLFDDPDDRLWGAMLMGVPIRALGGAFVSRFDRRWRYSAIEKRHQARAGKKATKALSAKVLE